MVHLPEALELELVFRQEGEEASVRNIWIRGARYNVKSRRRLEVYRDGAMIIKADAPVIIRGYVEDKDCLSFMLELKFQVVSSCRVNLRL